MPPNEQDNNTVDPLHPLVQPVITPLTDQPPASSAPASGGMKVIQPLSPNLEVSSPAPISAPVQAVPITSVPAPVQTAAVEPTTQPLPAVPNISSIYPEATRGINAATNQVPGPVDNANADVQANTFSEGYAIGGTIFWYQVLAGIVFGLLFYGLTLSVLKTTSTSIAAIIGLFHYVIEYLLLLYIPYSVLKSNASKEPFWLSLFGVASQTTIVTLLFGFLDILIIRTVIDHGVTSSITNTNKSGLAAGVIIVYICFIVASYFLTKLSWGIAFSLFSKITNKIVTKAIGIAVIAIIVGGVGYHYLTLIGKNSSSHTSVVTSNNSGSFSTYDVKSTPPFSVKFFKGSVATTIQGQPLLLNSPASGGQAYVYVKTATAPTTSCTSATATFTFFAQGTQGIEGVGCYESSGSDGYFRLNGQNYDVALRDDIFITQQKTQYIFDSININ
jgi:hypothetical protein